ncbi:DNA-binding protein [Paraburkholderia sp. UYCP14C]|uniref:helix-turn-helix transcriptional regulator n=1 Tax=Paraburkholderia sp. UYCP14C TaxID=2511130 RepID=UPI00101FA925|nr:helix-turn-helix domain-containing protein [Paraburkholderia sp. UYCP14C]RZF25698.1 DNA-binding protein [Paraburkholderia sp. UYCP14C]
MTLQAKQPQSVKLHRIKNAALLLGVSKPTIYRLVRAGELTLVKLGRRASAITDDSLCEFIASHTQIVGEGS